MKTVIGGVLGLALLTAPCRADLIHYYPFTVDVSDAAGSANGTLLGGASVSGGVLHLDGVNDYVQFAQDLVPTSGSYSVAMFARQDAIQSNFIELISQGLSGGPGFYLGHDPAGNIRASDQWISTGVAFPADFLFHHFALTVDALLGTSRLYVDGVLRANLGFAITSTSSGTFTRLGRQFDPFTEFFDGAIDDVRIYDRALSGGEVAGLAGVTTSTPEPTSLALCGTGAAFLLALGRRRKRERSTKLAG